MAREDKDRALLQLTYAYNGVKMLFENDVIEWSTCDVLRRQIRFAADYIMVGEEWGEREKPIDYAGYYKFFNIGNPGYSHTNAGWMPLDEKEA